MRPISRVIRSIEVREGAGFLVHRPFPVPGLSHIDPFLLIDQLGPTVHRPGEAKGAPDHPHRGFQTITYVLEGGLVHEDSSGTASELQPGDVQWMTAGKGIVHSEMPTRKMQIDGGRSHSIQIWLNLPRAKKTIDPFYQDIKGSKVPARESGGVFLKVFGGEVNGLNGPAMTEWPATVAHVTIATGARFATDSLSEKETTLLYALEGECTVQGNRIEVTDLVHFSSASGTVVVENHGTVPASVLILSSPPIGEPVVRMGPFVMNTRAEIESAYQDYIDGKFGVISRKA